MVWTGHRDALDNAAGLLDAAGRWDELDSVRDACAARDATAAAC